MKIINTFFIALFILFNCKEQNKKNQIDDSSKNVQFELTKFTGSDTGGVYTGRIIKFSDKNSYISYQRLHLKSLSDTIIFLVFNKEHDNPTQNVIESKLSPDRFVKVHYETEISFIEGIEASRAYLARRLEYLAGNNKENNK